MEKTVRLQKRMPYGVRFAARQIVSFLLGALFAQTRLFDGLPSFAVALAASAPRSCLPAVCLGAIGGTILFAQSLLPALIGCAAVVACGAIRFALDTLAEAQVSARACGVTAFLCCIAAGVTTLLGGGFYLSGVLLYLCDGVLAGSAAYFIRRTCMGGKLLRQSTLPDSTEALPAAAAVSILLLSLSVIQIYVFVPARMLAALCIMLGAALYAEQGGGAVGILCGVTMEIACEAPGLACCWALGGLLGGLAGRRGRLYIPITVTIVAALYPLLTQRSDAVAVFAETAAAAAAFACMPAKTLRRLRPAVGSTDTAAGRADTALRDALQRTAKVTQQIAPYLAEQQLRQGIVPGTGRMTDRVRALACTDCGSYALCWETQPDETAAALSACFCIVRKQHSLSPDTLPQALRKSCARRNMLSAACVQAFEECAYVPAEGRVPAWCGGDPFSAASVLLADAAENCGRPRRLLPRESENALRVLHAYGVPAHTASCFVQDGRRVLTAETGVCTSPVPKAALTGRLGRECGCAFSLPVVKAVGESFRWSFYQRTRYRLRTGTAQHASDGKRCGDFFLTFAQDGKQVFLLSDGMGTGETAESDAQAAAEIFGAFLRAGVTPDCALRMVNTAMLSREDAESVATLDVVCVDLYTGKAVFYKAGAAPSYLLHGGKTDCISMPCMPIGILPQVQFARAERTLQKGDALLLVSDGACAMQDLSIRFTLGKFDGGSANELAGAVLHRAVAENTAPHADDATVLAVVVE